jgi:hypothetical protein
MAASLNIYLSKTIVSSQQKGIRVNIFLDSPHTEKEKIDFYRELVTPEENLYDKSNKKLLKNKSKTSKQIKVPVKTNKSSSTSNSNSNYKNNIINSKDNNISESVLNSSSIIDIPLPDIALQGLARIAGIINIFSFLFNLYY